MHTVEFNVHILSFPCEITLTKVADVVTVYLLFTLATAESIQVEANTGLTNHRYLT